MIETNRKAHGEMPVDTHYGKQELFEAITGYLTPAERHRALVHFGRGCPECWHILAKLAKIDSISDLAAIRERPCTAECGAPVAPALLRCFSFLSVLNNRASEHEDFVGLRPAHLDALGEACRQVDSFKRAVAFRRLVLEECRCLALRKLCPLVHGMEVALKELEDPDLEKCCPVRTRALQALGSIYLADDHRMKGQHGKTREYLDQAKKELNRDPRFKEIQATYHEIVSDFARGRGHLFEAHDALDEAEKYLEMCPIPGRRASVQVRRGLVWVRFGDPAQAIRSFRAALGEMPPGTQPRLCLDAWHHMAGSEVRLRRFNRARKILKKTTELYRDHASLLMRAQHAWMWAMIYLSEGRGEMAELKLKLALAIFEDEALVADAAQTLIELGRLYTLGKRSDKLAETALRFVKLMRRPEARLLSISARRELVDRACASGLEPLGITDPTPDKTNSSDSADEWIN